MAQKLSRDTSQFWRLVGLVLVELGGGVIGVILAGTYGLSDQYSLAVIGGGIAVVLLSVQRSQDFGLPGIIIGISRGRRRVCFCAGITSRLSPPTFCLSSVCRGRFNPPFFQ